MSLIQATQLRKQVVIIDTLIKQKYIFELILLN